MIDMCSRRDQVKELDYVPARPMVWIPGLLEA
jgi:hypothetical protein